MKKVTIKIGNEFSPFTSAFCGEKGIIKSQSVVDGKTYYHVTFDDGCFGSFFEDEIER